MSELARRRSARDIWISRGHLYALGAGGALVVLAAFAAGYNVGRQSVEVPAVPAHRFAGEAGDDALVELLARVDAASTPDGGVLELTFPDALAGRGPSEVDADVDGSEADVQAASGAQGVALDGSQAGPGELAAGDAPPRGAWTVAAVALPTREDADRVVEDLVGRGVQAWVGVEQLGGQPRFRVSVGGWGSRAEAEAALPQVQDAVIAVGGSAEIVRY